MASSFEQSTTKTPKKQKIRTVIRNAAEQDWTDTDVIPDKGELVYASDVNTLKIGDGITDYVNLPAIANVTIPDPLPSQTGNAGKFLTTDGSQASWSNINQTKIIFKQW